MNTSQIESAVEELVANLKRETFILDLLLAYGLPKATITRLKKGQSNLSKEPGVISLKNRVLFKVVEGTDLHVSFSDSIREARANQRFVIVTDFKRLLAQDMRGHSLPLDIKFGELVKHFAYFLPWAGLERVEHHNENPADRKAAEKLAKLYDDLKSLNHIDNDHERHALNVFLTRLLFCLFAEDTGIFEEGLFTTSMGSHTQPDGSDLADYLERIFLVMGQESDERESLPAHLEKFPFVGKSLFGENLGVPRISRKGRAAILEAGELDWSEINPDIFGSMIQAVVAEDNRGELGMHYTSVPNIMKVIGPLFLDELNSEFEAAQENEGRLRKLLHRIHQLHIFDPACGSGNFLIITYKELRRLEMKILKRFNELPISGVQLGHFHGIEIDDFAHEAAKLSMWLSEHQMNREFENIMGLALPSLPLKAESNIVCQNACLISWEKVVPPDCESYIVGNPPYLGYSMQSPQQRQDMKKVIDEDWVGTADYISCWFVKAANYLVGHGGRAAFVSTNSIVQGEQVAGLWGYVFSRGIEIGFAHKSFRWTNNAAQNAGVSVVVIGLQQECSGDKLIIDNHTVQRVKCISPYLTSGTVRAVTKRKTPLSSLPQLTRGSGPVDGGGLILTKDEKDEVCAGWVEACDFVKPFIGAEELISGKERFCIWVENTELERALRVPTFKSRFEKVREFRSSSKKAATRKGASTPYRFMEIRHQDSPSLVIPSVSSERRNYLPIALVSRDVVVSNLAQFIADASPLEFSIISSKMHMAWLRTVGGRLETRYRYSSALVYNTFPMRTLSAKSREELSETGLRILATRERYPSKTLAELYDPDMMPEDLLEAHRLNDEAVDRCYRPTPYRNDEERLQTLFNLYVQLVDDESNNGSLFAKGKKPRKKK